ncbi:hypothetical protein FS749_009305, partial [Ceratobasidium sp. UAMH 11750]
SRKILRSGGVTALVIPIRACGFLQRTTTTSPVRPAGRSTCQHIFGPPLHASCTTLILVLMAFDAQALWDLSGPTTLPSMSGDDFLQLLEKQMQAAHPTTGLSPVNDTQSLYNPAGLMVSPAAVMGSAPGPMDSATPPLTDESSPSPPASVQENNTVGDGTKRKAGRETSREGQPRAKVQHKASDDGVNSQPQG